ncbi:hypothetical protein EV424DRAFT_1557097 [Suillus variegatus]|nr:hypothetical protein EV424DRAFT_1557097 [Suillus variegatus]
MASQLSQHNWDLVVRAQKSMGLINGTPTYMPIEGFVVPDVLVRTYHYSPDGRLFAYSLPTVVQIFLAEGAQLLQELSVPNIIELKFSPRGTYLSTWERPVKLEDGAQHKNIRYTMSKSHAICLVAQEIQVYCPAEWRKGIVDKLRVEGASVISLSPGLNPFIAVFVAEKKGAPAVVKIYGLSTLSGAPTCSKTFYKADRVQIKWNDLGTQALVLTQTEVDNSNMSYYGETGMYLLAREVISTAASPWTRRDQSMTSRGAQTQKNLALSMDMYLLKLHSLINVCGCFTILDPLLITSSLSIRKDEDLYHRRTKHLLLLMVALRQVPFDSYPVSSSSCGQRDQDVALQWWTYALEELYQASWRPTPLDQAPPFGSTIPAALQPSIAIFKHEDEGGAPRMPTGSSTTPPRGYNCSLNPPSSMGHADGARPSNENGHYQNGNRRRRHVSGATSYQVSGPGPYRDKSSAGNGTVPFLNVEPCCCGYALRSSHEMSPSAGSFILSQLMTTSSRRSPAAATCSTNFATAFATCVWTYS